MSELARNDGDRPHPRNEFNRWHMSDRICAAQKSTLSRKIDINDYTVHGAPTKRANESTRILFLSSCFVCHASHTLGSLSPYIRRGKSHLLFIYSNVYCLLNMLSYTKIEYVLRAHSLTIRNVCPMGAQVVHSSTKSDPSSEKRKCGAEEKKLTHLCRHRRARNESVAGRQRAF